MKRSWKILSNLGIDENMPYEDARKVRLLNQVSALCTFILLIFVFINIFFPRYTLALFEFGSVLIFLLNFYFHYKKKYLLTSILFFSETYLFVVLLCFVFSPTRNLEYMFLILSIFPLALFKNKKLIYPLSGLCALLFIIAKYRVIKDADFVSYLNGLMLFLLLFFIVKYLKDEHEGYRTIVDAQNRELKKLNDEKNELISIASHDLRSPLKRINGLLSLLTYDQSKLTTDQIEIISKAKEVASQNIELVTKILNLQSIENNKKPELYKINIIDLVSPIVKSFEPEASNKEITIRLTPLTGSFYAIGNEDYVKQVFENLISNSIKFSYPKTTVSITLHSDSNYVYVSVKDQGQGLSSEDKKNLFRKFQRLSAQPTSGEQSSGLGLAIVKKYLDAMNGTIQCESEQGKGAEFIVQLPIAV